MNGIDILIVEDEAIISADIESRLKKMGYGIAGIASRGEEAVKLALHDRPQLVLMDIQLSGAIDGIETAEEIKRLYNVPVVYLTAHSDSATLSRAKLTGPYGFVRKPIENRELQTQIELAIYNQSDKQKQTSGSGQP